MDVTFLFKIAGVGFLIAAAYQILQKSGRDEMSSASRTMEGSLRLITVLP